MGRGLSEVQQEIMEAARLRGYITPAEAVDAAWLHDAKACDVRSTASRALRRLCARGLLRFERAQFQAMANLYVVVGWYGPTPPFIWSAQANNADRCHYIDVDVIKLQNALALWAAMDDEKAIGQAAS
jgi:hypothetical protein